MVPLPQDAIPEEDSSCCSSTVDPEDITVMDNDMTAENSRSGHFLEEAIARIVFWRNLLLAFVVGTGIALSLAAHFCFAHWEQLLLRVNEDQIPSITIAVLAVSFLNVAFLIVWFTHHILQLLPPDDNPTLAGSAQDKHNMLTSVLTRQLSSLRPAKKLHNQSVSTIRTALVDSSVRSEHYSSAVDNIQDFLTATLRESQIYNDISTRSSLAGYQDKPIAELFTDTTLMFADIEGFTAWSSTREPSQVFVLLETLYHSFDAIAFRRKVFKVETVGDCYVAVTGLPEPRKDHAVAMARFARDCLKRMKPLCKRLVVQLGPDTCDLNIRIGIHSGSVTGGVLRGERSRFQLFGDTVNTASRIESTGQGGQIHVSNATAQLLKQAGKGHWVTPRPTKVQAKGKGALSTWWLNTNSNGSDAQSSFSGFSSEEESEDASNYYHTKVDSSPDMSTSSLFGGQAGMRPSGSTGALNLLGNVTSNSKLERLVSWNVDLLHRLLKQIVARRQCLVDVDPNRKADADESIYSDRAGTLLDEVKESIELPSFNYSRIAAEQADTVELDPAVYEQLKDYVRTVASMYPDNPFHNFEHASHVTMSVTKLLSRIVAPSGKDVRGLSMDEAGRHIHDNTFGITSDPLTQFACVLSALIHDADHPGVPNAQLVKEQAPESQLYQGKSVAEQNSMDKCWALLMSPKYKALRKSIYTTESGLRRFRSLVVNSVLATDICDTDLKNLRNARWEKAFQKTRQTENGEAEDEKAASDRKATIVIEHLIQASDVAHCMQHWHIYRKWNERLFRECYKAYKEGRATKDPSDYWYEGEKGFYDFYIIPLARKLQDCGVFGVSSSEYLDYALKNREEWECQGREVVEEMMANVKEHEGMLAKMQGWC